MWILGPWSTRITNTLSYFRSIIYPDLTPPHVYGRKNFFKILQDVKFSTFHLPFLYVLIENAILFICMEFVCISVEDEYRSSGDAFSRGFYSIPNFTRRCYKKNVNEWRRAGVGDVTVEEDEKNPHKMWDVGQSRFFYLFELLLSGAFLKEGKQKAGKEREANKNKRI